MINAFYRLVTAGILIMPAVCISAVELQDELKYNQVTLRASSSVEIENDLMMSVLAVELDGNDPARLADKVNQLIAWAQKNTRSYPAVQLTTGNYYVNPIRDKVRISQWRAVQSISLKSKDVTAMSQLIGELQSRLQIKSLGFSVSPERQYETENSLIDQALEAFKERANIIARNMSGGSYRIVNISVVTGGGVYQPGPVMRTMSATDISSVSTPEAEAGASRVTVTVSGTIHID